MTDKVICDHAGRHHNCQDCDHAYLHDPRPAWWMDKGTEREYLCHNREGFCEYVRAKTICVPAHKCGKGTKRGHAAECSHGREDG